MDLSSPPLANLRKKRYNLATWNPLCLWTAGTAIPRKNHEELLLLSPHLTWDPQCLLPPMGLGPGPLRLASDSHRGSQKLKQTWLLCLHFLDVSTLAIFGSA